MTPSLPAALALLAVLAAPSLAAPAAPDFEPMLQCDPSAHARFKTVEKFVKNSPEFIAAKRDAFIDGMNTLTKSVDDLAWPLDDRALPTGCRIGEEKIKAGVYGALSGLRKEFDEKTRPVIPEEDRSAAAALTEKETAADAMMGESVKSAAEFKAKALGVSGGLKDYAGDGSDLTKQRAVNLAARLTGFHKRANKAEAAGGAIAGGAPAAVLENEAKRTAEAKKRAAGAKGLSFGGDKTDNLPDGPGVAQTAEIRGSGDDHPGALSEANSGGRSAPKKLRRPRAVENAVIEENTDPDDDPSVLTEAVKDSATKPLGGAVIPPSREEAERYEARKEAIKAKILRLNDGKGSDNAFDEINFTESLPQITGAPPQKGEGVYVLTPTNGGQNKLVKIVNGKMQVRPGELTAEEAAVIEARLAR